MRILILLLLPFLLYSQSKETKITSTSISNVYLDIEKYNGGQYLVLTFVIYDWGYNPLKKEFPDHLTLNFSDSYYPNFKFCDETLYDYDSLFVKKMYFDLPNDKVSEMRNKQIVAWWLFFDYFVIYEKVNKEKGKLLFSKKINSL